MKIKTIKRPNRGGTVVITQDHERAIRLVAGNDRLMDAAKLQHHILKGSRPLKFPAGDFIQVWTREEARRDRRVPVRVFRWLKEHPGVEKAAYCHGVMMKYLLEKLDAGEFREEETR